MIFDELDKQMRVYEQSLDQIKRLFPLEAGGCTQKFFEFTLLLDASQRR